MRFTIWNDTEVGNAWSIFCQSNTVFIWQYTQHYIHIYNLLHLSHTVRIDQHKVHVIISMNTRKQQSYLWNNLFTFLSSPTGKETAPCVNPRTEFNHDDQKHHGCRVTNHGTCINIQMLQYQLEVSPYDDHKTIHKCLSRTWEIRTGTVNIIGIVIDSSIYKSSSKASRRQT